MIDNLTLYSTRQETIVYHRHRSAHSNEVDRIPPNVRKFHSNRVQRHSIRKLKAFLIMVRGHF
jgi:hypothetical protein